jgi:hypothetical protein
MLTNPLPPFRWLLEVEGEPEELQALGRMFPPQNSPDSLSVRFFEDRCYLHMPEFEGMDSHKSVWARGQFLIERLNALGRLKFGGFRPVRMGDVVRRPTSGEPRDRVSMIRPVLLRGPTDALRLYLDHNPNRPPVMNAATGAQVVALPPAEAWIGVPDRLSPDIDFALHLLNVATEGSDWRDLYLAYELIEEKAGQPSWMEKQGWAKKTEINRFKKTANSWGVLRQ